MICDLPRSRFEVKAIQVCNTIVLLSTYMLTVYSPVWEGELRTCDVILIVI